MTFVVSVGYLLFDLYNGINFAWPYQLGCALFAFISFVLNRIGKFSAAKIILGLSTNLTLFIFAVNEPLEAGLYMFFITTNLGALIAFGYEERGKAIFFTLFSTTLFLLSVFIDFEFIPQPLYSQEYIQANVIINFISSSIGSALIIYFLISINHRAESQMAKNEKEISTKNSALTKLNHELDRFVFSTSHDLRAPLMSIHGLLQLTKLSHDAAELKSFHTMMESQVDTLDKLIRDIADYARNSQQSIILSNSSVKKIVLDSIESLRFFPGAEKVKIHWQVPEDLRITTDLTRLQIILSNLISNAFKYHDSKKENSFIRITAKERLDKIIFTIEDNGIGIPNEYLNKIFEMYTRAHEQSFGSGLGLYIVKEAIEKLGGTIQVQSRVAEGSMFTLDIPNFLEAANEKENEVAQQMKA
ncbi:MAG TPA: HAMP domain-containing sensor histidine kinase [Chryseolinea sp.]|nr:HAMP domain-containing sensor histidine kinase [Chryseolinea sp.]HPM32029.1 HAMP domain-containing sensor histidine kinase [Chryseolinea sp.]